VLASGTDITHWFDKNTREPKTFIDPIKNIRQFYSPQGAYLHLHSVFPDSEWSSSSSSFKVPWWRDTDKYLIGHLTKKVRKIKLINMLTKHEDSLEVGAEESVNEILDRYLELNLHAASYTWKRLGQVMDMNKNLEENGMEDES
jgi:hypothetical protein